ncbi:MAG: LLM class flavin-dependent oxidoreductase [Acidobacteria bacterium]|nr:LLM class flavin-dependent oxidoreductase [Acidobacteriota bacterium]
MRLSVLDQSPVADNASPGEALRNSIDLARAAERAGYHRYWLAEHHRMPALACASPEVLIAAIAGATERIRVGSGGIMLPHYSSLKVASTFSMLAGLYPGRIDLGVGRAAGTSASVARALQRDRRQTPPDDFLEQLTELLGYFEPGSGFDAPEPFLLGSSGQSAVWAAELGLPYVFADFINPSGQNAAQEYRRLFQPSARLASPNVGVAVSAICAETPEQAMRLSLSQRMLTVNLYRGRLIRVPSVERAERWVKEENVPLAMLPAGRRMITGDARTVRAALEAVAAEYGADEVFVVNLIYDHAARRRSYELLAA